MNVPGFNAEASVYRGQSYRSSRLSTDVPGRVAPQAPPQPGYKEPQPGGFDPGPPPPGPCVCWQQCIKNKTAVGKSHCNRLYHLAKCLNEESDWANCFAVAIDNWSKPPCKA
jgi:hypothetical protein